jgi:hypothetical protein
MLIVKSDTSTCLLNWGFAMGHWIADGDPEPEIPFPEDWEVCGTPDFDPLELRLEYKRHGQTTWACPMYDVGDPLSELDAVCEFLEKMTADAMVIWLSLQDRYLSMACGDTEMDAAEMDTRGFHIPPELIRRTRRLRLRLRITFHPHATIRSDIDY